MKVFNYLSFLVSAFGLAAGLSGGATLSALLFGVLLVLSVFAVFLGPVPRSVMRRVVNQSQHPNENGYYWSLNAELEDDGSVCFMLFTDDQVHDAMSRAGKQPEDVSVTPEEV